MSPEYMDSFILGELSTIEQFSDRQAQEDEAWDTIRALRDVGEITAQEADEIFYYYLQRGC